MINEIVMLDEATDEWVLPNLGISGNSLRLANPNMPVEHAELTP